MIPEPQQKFEKNLESCLPSMHVYTTPPFYKFIDLQINISWSTKEDVEGPQDCNGQINYTLSFTVCMGI